MAGIAQNPSRVAGMHFFNPVHKDEARSRSSARSESSAGRRSMTVERGGEARWARKPCSCAKSPGFVTTTRVNASIGNEAFYMLMEGVASAP